MDSLISECLKLDIESSFLNKKSVLNENNTSGDSSQQEVNSNKNDKKTKKSSQKKDKAQKEPKIGQRLKQSINPSKRHRDRLNSELDNLAKLLPFSEDVIARLDKLSILRLSVSYLRNKNFFKGAVQQEKHCDKLIKSLKDDEHFGNLFNQALEGFVLVITLNGEVFYVSEKVKEFLGYSQSQILHQPFETLVHDDDREEVALVLKGPNEQKIIELGENEVPKQDSFEGFLNQQKDFVVRLKSVLNTNSSDMYKSFRITGTVRRLNIEPDIENLRYALFGFCTPARTNCSVLEIRMKTTLFCSKNRIDLSFLDLDARGKEFFGYSKKDIFGRSSYVLAHRQDLQHLRCKHSEIMICGRTSVGMFRLMNKNNEWNWVCGYGRVLYKNGKPDFMVTTNRVMSEEEGQAMLKLRDEADYKSLSKIGLVEPEDPAKALELGFPNRATSTLSESQDLVADDDPIPMPLDSFLPPDMPPMYHNPPISTPPHVDMLESTANEFFDAPPPDEFMQQPNRMILSSTSSASIPAANALTDEYNSNNLRGPSPSESHISVKTEHSRGSVRSTSSYPGDIPQRNVNEASVKHEDIMREQSLISSPHSVSHYANNNPAITRTVDDSMSLGCLSNSSASSHSPPNMNTQSYMNDATNFDYKANLHNIQNLGRHSEITSVIQNLPPNFMHQSNDFYRNMHQQELQTQANVDRHMSLMSNSQNNIFPNTDSRVQFSPYDQTGPNVTLSTPEYPDLSSAINNMQMEFHNTRERMISQQNRAPNIVPGIFESGWNRTPVFNSQRTALSVNTTTPADVTQNTQFQWI